MTANFTLDEMILRYTQSPFVDDKNLDIPANTDYRQKRKVLSRLLFIANNLLNREPEAVLGSYKRRYEFK